MGGYFCLMTASSLKLFFYDPKLELFIVAYICPLNARYFYGMYPYVNYDNEIYHTCTTIFSHSSTTYSQSIFKLCVPTTHRVSLVAVLILYIVNAILDSLDHTDSIVAKQVCL